MVERTSNLSALLHQETEGIKLHISEALSEPWDQKPIYFQDAIGRRYPVPLEAAGDFDVCKLVPTVVELKLRDQGFHLFPEVCF
jgi:hypothetical protein